MNQYFVLKREKNGRYSLLVPSVNEKDDLTSSGFKTYHAAVRQTNAISKPAFVVKHYNEDDFNRDYGEKS